MQQSFNMGKIEWLMLLTLSVLWGSSFINIKISLIEIPPITLVFLRLCIAFSALFLWCLLRRKKLGLSYKNHLTIMLGGLLSCAIPFSLFSWGQQYVPTSIGAIFNGCVPFFTAFLVHFWIGGSERMSWRKAIGLLVGLLGIIVIIGFDNLTALEPTNIGQLAMILACFFYAFSSIYFQKFIPNTLDKTVVTTFTLFWGAVCISIVSLNFDGLPSLDYSADAWLSLSLLSLFSTALAYIILFRLLKRAGPSNTSLNTFIIPVVGIIIGIVFLGEQLRVQDIIGVMLIFTGVAIIQNISKLITRLVKQ